jgi:hypothetical protein
MARECLMYINGEWVKRETEIRDRVYYAFEPEKSASR